MTSLLTGVLGGLVRNPTLLLPLVAGGLWLRWKSDKLAGAGLIRRPARAGFIGALLLVASAVGFLLFMRNPRNRHAAVTAAIAAGVVVALGVAWWVPALRWQVIVPAAIVSIVWAFCPGDFLYEGQPGGALYTWLDGADPTPANIRAALARDRRNKLAPAALAACTGAAHVRSQTVDGNGTIRARVAVDAGASPAEIVALAEDGTLANAMNRLSEQERAGVEVVDTRVRRDGGEIEIEMDTTPRRLPKKVAWPGN